MADYIRLEVLNETNLDRLMGWNPEMEQVIRLCIKKALKKARNGAVAKLKGEVGSGYKSSAGDPRDAYKAVKYMTYKKVLGGNISILNKKKATNRRLTGSKMQSYYGSDRGFILRFLNSGTPRRNGKRGQIAAHSIFANIGAQLIEDAKDNINQMLMQKIELRTKEI